MESLQKINQWKPKMIVMVGTTPMFVKSIDTGGAKEALIKHANGATYYNAGRIIELKKFPKAERLGVEY